ncbi:uncharacterized protein LOC113324641 [Papaver somniferum]|uniref:uncharacterized protein LOC113324641 n=1 Tax=Papaver somniferum TaxID=3469 RepID=UPI000E6FF8BD|nr:uncharacterized protein LOC113324641 [Papaver somniferum]
MAIKLDLSKDFNGQEWPFILAVFNKLGFSDDWCQMISQCISTLSYSILVNGSPGEVFFPSRGIRQGDCLSPYIFIICMEALSQLLLKGEKDILVISHLFFADDCMLLSKASLIYARNFMSIINNFARASGQAINFDKSGFFTSSKLHHKHIKLLPKTLGRTVVTTHVLSSLAVYHMSCFPFPKKITAKIDAIQRAFWWSKKNPRRAVYFRSWGDIGKSKMNGGLGIRNSFATNRVLIAKLGWRLLKNNDQLVTVFLKDKYYPKQNLLEIDKAADSSSWIWKGIFNSITFLKENFIYKINNGKSTKIWSSNWIPGSSSAPISDNSSFGNYNFIGELIDSHDNSWNTALLSSFFSPDEVIRNRSI